MLLFTFTYRTTAKKRGGMNAKNRSNMHVFTCFSVIEENTCLTLCIAAGGKCPKVADNFFIAVYKNSSKIAENF